MPSYTYELSKYVTVEAPDEQTAEKLMWNKVIEDGSEDLSATLIMSTENNETTYHN